MRPKLLISKTMRRLTWLLSIITFSAVTCLAQTSAFTYQGRLASSGAPASGAYQFEFKLFDASTGTNQIGATQTLVATVQNGSFSTQLDFGAAAFPAGADRWLEISVRANGSGDSYRVLSPRQQVSSVPFAVRSLTATNAENATSLAGVAAGNYVQTSDARLSDARTPTAGSGDYIQNLPGIGQQSGSFNISGGGTANILNARSQFNLNGNRILSGDLNTASVFTGFSAGLSSTTGGANSFFGTVAGASNTTGNNNSFFGAGAGVGNVTGGQNSFFGTSSGIGTTGSDNAFFGSSTGASNSTGGNNTLIGTQADVGAPDLSFATAIGAGAVVATSNTIALGRSSGFDTVVVPGNLSVAGSTSFAGTFGASIFNAATSYHIGGNRVLSSDGSFNLFTGAGAGQVNSSGARNAFIGTGAGELNESGSDNTFVGGGAGALNVSGSLNVFVGKYAGIHQTFGDNNTLIGALADVGGHEQYISFATAIGAGASVSTSNTIALGRGNGADAVIIPGSLSASSVSASSLSANSIDAPQYKIGGARVLSVPGQLNVFVGVGAGQANSQGFNNSFFGGDAAFSNTWGANNSFFGASAGFATTTGTENTFLGAGAGHLNVTGESNTIIGQNANVGSGALNFATALGAGATVYTSNTVVLGRPEDTVVAPNLLEVHTFGAAGSTHLCFNIAKQISSCSSSIRYKQNINRFTSGLSLIKRLRPVSFNWRAGNQPDLGLVAEEVAGVEPLLTITNDKGEIEGVKYDRVGVVLVNAVQEQQRQIEAQQKQIDEQKKLIEALKSLACSQNPTAQICKSSNRD
jgi:PBP1b-binding outer membrane lipoprotein LpoB